MIATRTGIVAIWLAALLACGLIIAHSRFSTDMSAFLPRSPNPAQRILVEQLRDGVVSRLILVAIEGADPDTLAALSKTMAAIVRTDPAFGIVNNGEAGPASILAADGSGLIAGGAIALDAGNFAGENVGNVGL